MHQILQKLLTVLVVQSRRSPTVGSAKFQNFNKNNDKIGAFHDSKSKSYVKQQLQRQVALTSTISTNNIEQHFPSSLQQDTDLYFSQTIGNLRSTNNSIMSSSNSKLDRPRIPGRCDICERKDGSFDMTLLQCSKCKVCVHKECYMVYPEDDDDFVCYACA